jgi:hypothetical protein
MTERLMPRQTYASPVVLRCRIRNGGRRTRTGTRNAPTESNPWPGTPHREHPPNRRAWRAVATTLRPAPFPSVLRPPASGFTFWRPAVSDEGSRFHA